MYGLFILPELTKMATDLAVDYIAKRFVKAAAAEVSAKASSIGSSLLGGLLNSGSAAAAEVGAKAESIGSSLLGDIVGSGTRLMDALNSPSNVREMIETASKEIGISLVSTEELTALLKIAEAIETNGDVAACHAAWKKIAEANRRAA